MSNLCSRNYENVSPCSPRLRKAMLISTPYSLPTKNMLALSLTHSDLVRMHRKESIPSLEHCEIKIVSSRALSCPSLLFILLSCTACISRLPPLTGSASAAPGKAFCSLLCVRVFGGSHSSGCSMEVLLLFAAFAQRRRMFSGQGERGRGV